MTSLPVARQSRLALFGSERVWHLCSLSAFAFSEPLFAALTQQFVYLHDLNAGWFEIGYVLLILMVVIPGIAVMLDQIVQRAAARWGGRGKDLVLILLIFLVWLSILRPFLRLQFLIENALVWIVTLILATVATTVSSRLYQQSQWVRHWVSVAVVGIICFPAQFLYQYCSLSRVEVKIATVSVERPIPVVIVVFDELSGLSLMDRNLQIDAEHFPEFARLAQLSTWYRQASTVHVRTDVAIPAILSGQYPSVNRPPLESEYPGNLFQLIHGTGAYDMTVFEPITRLCPIAEERRQRKVRSRMERIASLTSTLAAVYPRLILPSDVPIEFPPISRLWFGLPENIEDQPTLHTGLWHASPFNRRDEQLQQFLLNLNSTEKPSFSFLHIELPHVPWCFLPSETSYNYEATRAFFPSGAWGEIGENWSTDKSIIARNEHRYLLQLQFVDRFIGRLLDQLKSAGKLDECLLVVTADHGVAFRAGHSRRVPDSENLSDLLSVPLFVKLPGQTKGEISDKNVESIDILPTITEILGLSLLHPVDGAPLGSQTVRPRKTLYFDRQMTVVEPEIPRMKSAIERRLSLFGMEGWDTPPAKIASHPAWHGRPTSEFEIVDDPLSSLVIEPSVATFDAAVGDFQPCLVAGILDPGELRVSSADLVVAVNSVVRDTASSFSRERGLQGFEFLLPEALVRQSSCLVELFHVERATKDRPQLRRLGAWNPHKSK